ncbi:hypothetical protein K461DRAFT_322995 [Myriangium duriaei CBS 260.36]|uniref:Uncharacterized protein n=1 Tax=Myriangium duriaei CBS 260.36 TaxID=1168546 RepID=A0A9P4IVV5_9PEZI|nr:hypothetical protein K461DRAFT_322995 [Myriangium duriaei CBS 260.36]
MSRPTICFRCSTALLRKNAWPPFSRSLSGGAPLFAKPPKPKAGPAKNPRAAPAVARTKRLRTESLEDRMRVLRPEDGPLSDLILSHHMQVNRAENPEAFPKLERDLAKLVDERLVPRLLVFMNYCVAQMRSEDKWYSQMQEKFDAGRKWCGISVGHAHELGRFLYRFRSDQRYARTSRMLLQCCSRSGYDEATLDLGISYQVAAKSDARSVITKQEYLQAREQVHELAKKGNLRAASLEAELTELDKGPKAALPYWDRAVKLALDDKNAVLAGSSRFGYLEQPWIRLAALKSAKLGDQEGANAALRIGMLKDDPDAYHVHSRQNQSQGEKTVLEHLEWMNSVTKSAASGSFRSAIDLGRHFADEASMDLSSVLNQNTSWWSNLMAWTGLRPGAQNRKAEAGAGVDQPSLNQYQYQTAAYADAARTPRDRMLMAIKWLEIAAKQGSIDAYLDLAILRSRKFIFGVHNLSLPIKHPDEQKDTDIKEYVSSLCGHEIDLAEAEPISKDTFAARTVTSQPFVWRKGTPNPFYDPVWVRFCLEMVGHGHVWMYCVRENGVKNSLERSMAVPVWYRFPDIGDLNEAHDEENWKKAKQLADTLGVDIMLANGDKLDSLHKHKGERGKGIAEWDSSVHGHVDIDIRDFNSEMRT